jgi:diacylglycerol kinase family enzyme
MKPREWYSQEQVDTLLAQIERTTVERERAAFFNGAAYGEIAACTTSVEDFPRKAHDEAARRFALPARIDEKVPA